MTRSASGRGILTVKWRRFTAMSTAMSSGTKTDTLNRTTASTPDALSATTSSLPNAGRNP